MQPLPTELHLLEVRGLDAPRGGLQVACVLMFCAAAAASSAASRTDMLQNRAMETLRLCCNQRGDLQGGTAAARLATAGSRQTGMCNDVHEIQTKQRYIWNNKTVKETHMTCSGVRLTSEAHDDQQQNSSCSYGWNFRELWQLQQHQVCACCQNRLDIYPKCLFALSDDDQLKGPGRPCFLLVQCTSGDLRKSRSVPLCSSSKQL